MDFKKIIYVSEMKNNVKMTWANNKTINIKINEDDEAPPETILHLNINKDIYDEIGTPSKSLVMKNEYERFFPK
ncbi:hypothetical protein V7161_10210 [Neobacillus drentensis]|uniref:hypothetical protein n=1 Tax=Neobacillus drentensis TaxID=220684 RepID=UPI002FFECD3E